MNILPFIDIIEDLNRDISAIERYSRMVEAMYRAYPCDAIALLKLEGKHLHPVAVLGLKHEALARVFTIEQHPRFKLILESREVTRFEADSPLPDPYDGLVDDSDERLHVHDCMGSAVYLDDKPWGVLTLDAMTPGSFDQLDPLQVRGMVALVAAVIKTIKHIEALEQRVEYSQEIAQRLMENEFSSAIIGRSPVIESLHTEINTVAPTDLSVLITGETGVGKELVARNLHQKSKRNGEALIQINCAALPENIVESELFGHLRGAFSGATNDRSGRFELADGGTLFLDEVGELPLLVQAKLLRALQSGEIQRVGSDKVISVDVRIIAATNRDLRVEVKEGRFRADLYHRLSVYPLPVAPLRERGKDVELLAGFFLEKCQLQLGVARLRLSKNANAQLRGYDWPGNVRELEHVLSRGALKAIREQGKDSKIISIEVTHLDVQINKSALHHSPDVPVDDTIEGAGASDSSLNFRDAVDHFQRDIIERKLAIHKNNIAATARSLMLDRSNLVRTMKRLGL